MNLYYTNYGDFYCLNNDIVFMNELKCGKVHDENLILNNIIPFLQNDKSKIILDIGSHIGSHSIMYANILNNCKIYAFEPQNVLFNILNKNIQINNIENIKIFNSAVGHKLCKTTMSKYLYDGYNCEIDYNTNKILNYGGMQLGHNGEHVDMITIDSLNLPSCEYIKMDVEGAESLVLYGALNTIRKYKPIIFFESTDKIVNNEMKELLHIDFEILHPTEILINEGYTIQNIDAHNKLAMYIV